MPNEKMNEFLKNRRLKNKKVQSYRNQRIKQNYKKLQNNLLKEQEKPTIGKEHQEQHQDEGQRRQIQFYKQIFNEKGEKVVNQQRYVKPEVVVDLTEQKLKKLKNKKKKFIKKMQNQKTKKGQPVMKNFIKYALTKIEQTIQLQKKSKKN